MPIKVGLISLGCSKNLVDSEVMLGILKEKEYIITNDARQADVLIINTCCFIDKAKEESIDAILSYGQFKEKYLCKLLIVAGCMAKRYKDELAREIPEVDCFIEPENIQNIEQAIRRFFLNEVGSAEQKEKGDKHNHPLPRLISTGKSTAYLKIADGCDNRCSYCVIPSIRGKYTSVPMEALIQEATMLAGRGIKELIIIAQDTTSYGIDLYGSYKLKELLNKLAQIDGLQWIRLMYCYPDKIDDELIEIIAGHDNICNYLDIPIQHINDEILARMNRSHDSQDIIRLFDKLREKISDVVIRTSLIVGFPGETHSQFDELCDFLKKYKINRVGAFTYSREESTPAANFNNQINQRTKQERLEKLMEIQREISYDINKDRLNKKEKVLIEGRRGADLFLGRSYAEAPEVDGVVFVKSTKELEVGQFVDVIFTEAYEYDMLGELI
ncbi:MAG TPA: 30S ribosomal protein S12 methylthiotransferase RimO [Clostridiales bacterium]|nr:30S ribosomal protein S12 methylthiotransferase RimO [Clostridiales bacterium]